MVQLTGIVFADQNPEHHERSRWLKVVVGLINTCWGTRSKQKCWIAHLSKWPLYLFPRWHHYRRPSFRDFCQALRLISWETPFVCASQEKSQTILILIYSGIPPPPPQKTPQPVSQNEGKCDIMDPQVFIEMPKLYITLFSCSSCLHLQSKRFHSLQFWIFVTW